MSESSATLVISPLPRAIIDAWPLVSAGLPVRVVNSTSKAGLRTVGDLRAWPDDKLLGLRSLGRVSVQHIHSFFDLCARIEDGRQTFPSIREVAGVFLDESEMSILGARYGLTLDTLKPSRTAVTLQEIGNLQQKTRERVRQVEEAAKAALRSDLAQVCLEPVFRHVTSAIEQRNRAAAPEELSTLRPDPVFGGWNPASVVLLLRDLQPERLTFHRGFFSTLTSDELADLECAAERALAGQDQPVTLEALMERITAGPDPRALPAPVQPLVVLLAHLPSVAATTDGRYFLFETAVQSFLAETLRSMPAPAHYRDITTRFNERVQSASRKGSGYILDLLSRNQAFRRVDRGVYDLA